MTAWPALRDTPWLLDVVGDADAAAFWKEKFDQVHAGGLAHVNGWDWPWLFACWIHRGLSILPGTNLISNIGFGATATHTRRVDDVRANVPTGELAFPLRHPPYMARDTDADRRIVNQFGGLRRRPQGYRAQIRHYATALPAPVRRTLSWAASALAAVLESVG
jgi:hypothetical protein